MAKTYKFPELNAAFPASQVELLKDIRELLYILATAGGDAGAGSNRISSVARLSFFEEDRMEELEV
jgi:hypothetical protein